MSREWIAGIAAGAYPADVRAERGAELVGTLLDAGDDSRSAFGRQLCSVVGAGLAARAREALTQPLAQLVISALAWAAVMEVVWVLVELLGVEARATGQIGFPEGAFLTWILPLLAVVSFTLRRTRISGILGVAFIVSHQVVYPGPMPGTEFARLVLPFVGFALLALAPRRIPLPGRWLWLVPAVLSACFEVAQIGFYSGVDVIVPLYLALCFLPFQPSFVIGTGLAWSVPEIINHVAIPGAGWTTPGIMLISCGPLALVTASIARLHSRRG